MAIKTSFKISSPVPEGSRFHENCFRYWPHPLFARAGRLDLLRQVVGELIVSNAVVEEIAVRGKGRPGAEEVRQETWIKRSRVRDRSLVEQLSGKLNQGEREALVLAQETGAALAAEP